MFKGECPETLVVKEQPIGVKEVAYKLTESQNVVSEKIKDNFINKINTLVYAVCGAGKTELVYKTIEHALEKNMTIGFAIPRKDVVEELSERLKNAFRGYHVVALFGGHTSEIKGDIICLTTHQLFRYDHYFDLLIIDEIDAFPFKGNEILNHLFLRSIKGNYIMMSATPSKEVVSKFDNKGYDIVTLFKRHHGAPIPVPRIKIAVTLYLRISIIKKLKQYVKENKPCLIFVPTISQCENLYKFLKIFVNNGFFVHSKRTDRSLIIQKFRKNEYKYLVTTAVLERGVTLKNLQVLIYKANARIYDWTSLVQISGRVGRVKGATTGDVIFYATKKTEAMDKAISIIKRSNQDL